MIWLGVNLFSFGVFGLRFELLRPEILLVLVVVDSVERALRVPDPRSRRRESALISGGEIVRGLTSAATVQGDEVLILGGMS